MNKQGLQFALHLSAFMLSLLLVISISIDTFRGVYFYDDANYLDLQFWICMMLMLLFFIEVYNAADSWRYFGRHFLFFLLTIPYLPLFDWWGIELSGQSEYLFRFIPLIRGYIALTILAYGLLRDLASGLLVTYIVLLFSFIYYCSLIFYVLEVGINPQLHTFWDSVWYSCMTATTAGCNISATTTVGKIVSVMLALAGMMLLPVFTVYLTSLIRTGKVSKEEVNKEEME